MADQWIGLQSTQISAAADVATCRWQECWLAHFHAQEEHPPLPALPHLPIRPVRIIEKRKKKKCYHNPSGFDCLFHDVYFAIKNILCINKYFLLI